MATVPADVEGPSDAELIEAVRKGTVSAYGALYERHVAAAYNLARQLARSPAEADDLVSESFAKVLDTLRAGRGPDSAFRAYLLTALRHTAYDKTRRERKLELSDDVSTVSGVSAAAVSQEFDDPAVADLERSLAAQAFQRLPERWQAVLWHTEIEGQSPQEVAPILGLTPNGVSALAYRAREGLRQAYLQVHLAETSDRSCRAAAAKLGSWTRGGLAKREKAQVEAHLDTCERCRSLAAELADVNGAMRAFVAPIVLGVGALGYLATTGAAQVAAAGVAVATGAAGSAAGAAASVPRQFLGVAASSVALAAAIAIGLTAGGERPPIPQASPVPTQEQRPPATSNPPPPQQPQQQEPPAQEPPASEPSESAPPPSEPAPSPSEPAPQPSEPAPEPPAPTPAMLEASVPNMPFSMDANGAPVDLPLTVRNTGGSMSEPVAAVLNLPQGVSAIPVDELSGHRLLSLDGPRAGTVNCPGGHGTVTCTSEQGLAPDETVTLLFRLIAADNAKGGKITGVVTAGVNVNTSFTVQLNVRPAPVTDGVKVTAENAWPDLLGWWTRPVVDVTVTNTGTSSRPVKLSVDQPGEVVSSTQTMTCSVSGATSCLTNAELAPGEKLKITLQLDLDSWSQKSLATTEVHISATLGSATDSTSVTVWDCFWPTKPTPPTQPGEPGSPPTPPSTTTPPGTPTMPTEPTVPTEPNPPATTTTPPTTTTTPDPGTGDQGRDHPSTPPPTEPPTTPEESPGLLGGLLGWLLGG
ncbi:sigma-70 family RNA polymerase sigma factor [Actinophytocola sp.]|uniref:sigma-70 family RNA polymerase sigma factor n=1 Tax=Actinophytocola sp. TaxID=1872138 RepID=UPI00389A3232